MLPLSSAMRSGHRNFRDQGYIRDERAAGGMGGTDEKMLETMAEERQTLKTTVANRYFWWLGDTPGIQRYTPHGKPLSYQTGKTALGTGDLVFGYAGYAAYSYEDQDPLSIAERTYEAVPRWAPRTQTFEHRGFSRTVEYTPKEYEYLSWRSGMLYYREANTRMKEASWTKATNGERQDKLRDWQTEALKKARAEVEVKFPEFRRRKDTLMNVMAVQYETELEERRAQRAAAIAGGG